MLETLHVRDLALVKEIEIDFQNGFNVLTGETGAGKSIILGSVNLALGGKASPDLIRSGAESALIELIFKLNQKEIDKIKELELDIDEDGVVILQRKITPQKTVSRMNGQTVSVSQLKQLSEILMDVYGQHDYQSLLKASSYMRMLDDFAGDEISNQLQSLKEEYSNYRDLIKKRENENSDENVRNREIELLKFEIEEIEQAKLEVGEDEELEKRFKFLSNIRKIMEAVSSAQMAIDGDEASAIEMIGFAGNKLKSVESYDEEVHAIAESVSEAEGILLDIKRALKSYENRLDFDGEEFSIIEERLNVINHLKDKYSDSIERILLIWQEKSEELDKLINYEEYLVKLENDINNSKKRLLDMCEKVSSIRTTTALNLEKKLIESLKSLNFLNTELKILITPDEEKISANGYDNVEFLISTNPGEALKPMHQVASGGELSRIMLAIKSIFADKDDVSTLLFDEIDSGISGTTAYKVAEMMNRLADSHQLIAITHLPQIAAMGGSHYMITKKVIDDRTVTAIEMLDEDNSIKELARMLGADEITESAIENAKELKSRRNKA